MHGSYLLAAPTQAFRATLTREIREILPASAEGFMRRVTVLMPEGQQGYICPDVLVMTPESNSVVPPEGLEYSPEGLGPNESYRLPPWPQGQAIFFWLLPGQTLVGASQMEAIYAGLVVEYWK